MTKLDALVRRMILSHPLLFGTRWDVLRHVYLHFGTGLEWVSGELVDVTGHEEKTEAECVAAFFSDIDDFRETFSGSGWREEDARADELKRRRRQFILDNLDLIVREDRIDSGVPFDATHLVATMSEQYSPAFHVPANAEPSFRDGAIEVLGELLPGLYYLSECGQDRDLRAVAQRELSRLRPEPDPAVIGRLLAEMGLPTPAASPSERPL